MSTRIPRPTHHKGTNQAVVRLCGKDFYLGRWGTAKASREYDRLIAEWMANGRRIPQQETLIEELIDAFLDHAESHYVKNGKPTDEIACHKSILKYLYRLYGDKSTEEFGPLPFKAIRQQLIAAGNSRGYINLQMSRLRHVFKWGVANDLVPVDVHARLQCVTGLQKGKTVAREADPVLPVDDETIEATLPHLFRSIADMVRVHRLVGGRPTEICQVRPCDIDRTGEVWEYVPREHKNEHRNKQRVIFIGPKAKAILLPYLLRPEDRECFWSRSRRPLTERSYRNTIHRACDKIDIPRWNPNQLRHATGTDVRRSHGLEAAQVILGHSKADTTQIYAERDYELARKVVREIG